MRSTTKALSALSILVHAGLALGAAETFRLEVPAMQVELLDGRGVGDTLVRAVGPDRGVAPVLTVTPRVVVELAPDADAQAIAFDHAMALVEVTVFGDARFAHLDAGSGGHALRTVSALRGDPRTLGAQVMVAGLYERTGVASSFTDPHFGTQVHLVNTGQLGGTPGVDLNVSPAWDAGWNGAGVTIQVVDDGIQHEHPDLSEFYDPSASFDRADNDANPTSNGTQDFHGTPCAGLALGNDDSDAGVGVAYEASLSAVRQQFQFATPADLAFAHNFAKGINDVSSNSYGPSDAALLVAPLSSEQTAAIRDAVLTGRDGKGVVFFVSGGNGKMAGDDANFNGFASSRFTASITAVDQLGESPDYAEPGACHLVCAVSSGDGIGVVSTDLLGPPGINGLNPDLDATNSFGGTSAVTPQASGVAALMLQANPELSWRDVHWLLATTARQIDPSDPGWSVNGAGYAFNHQYGFGLIDAHAAVEAATTWTNVPAEDDAFERFRFRDPLEIPDNGSAQVEIVFEDPAIDVIETVELRVTLNHADQGDVRIEIIAPSGATSVISERPGDDGTGYTFTFTSVRHLGESPEGAWTVRFTDTETGDTGAVTRCELRMWGYTRPGNACAGDFNNDGDVDLGDFGGFGEAFGSTSGDANFNPDADFNGDGDVDLGDFGAFATDFGRTDCL